jgi:hypothetical protein
LFPSPYKKSYSAHKYIIAKMDVTCAYKYALKGLFPNKLISYLSGVTVVFSP